MVVVVSQYTGDVFVATAVHKEGFFHSPMA